MIRKYKDQIGKIDSLSFYFPRHSGWIFILCFLLMAFFYDYHSILGMRPQGIHQWRQCDGLSMTMNYYMDDQPFFSPAVHSQESDEGDSGLNMAEFPIIYYVIGNIWKITRHNEALFRLFDILMVLLGLFFFMKLCEHLLKDSFWAIIIALLLFTSPVLAYYANSFIPNTTSFSLILAAWYGIIRYREKQSVLMIVLVFTSFLLAGMIKVTHNMSLIILNVVLFLSFFYKDQQNKKDFKKLLLGFILPVLLFIIILSYYFYIKKFNAAFIIFNFLLLFVWFFSNNYKRDGFRKIILYAGLSILILTLVFLYYYYAKKFNLKHHSGMFSFKMHPVWVLGKDKIWEYFQTIAFFWTKEYFPWIVNELLFISFLLYIYYFKKISFFLRHFIWISIVAGIIYFLFWFDAMAIHDYYILDLFFIACALIISFFIIIKDHFPKLFSSLYFRIFFIVILILAIPDTSKKIRNRYSGWMNEKHLTYFKALEDINPYLRSLGIQRDDKVLSIPDPSFNITLYLMDQKGYTSGGSNGDKYKMERMLNNGLKYIIVNNPEVLSKPELAGYLEYPIGKYKNILLYDLRQYSKE